MTFTTAAAAEIKERVQRVVEGGKSTAKELSVSTFHSFCLQLCRQYAASLGCTENFIVYSAKQQRRALIAAIETVEGGKKGGTEGAKEGGKENQPPSGDAPQQLEAPSKAQSTVAPRGGAGGVSSLARGIASIRRWEKHILQVKAAGLSPEDLEDKGQTTAAAILREYERMLKENDALDYTDFVSSSLRLLQENKEALQECQQKWTHVLVDEFQDTSELQLRFVAALTSHGRITVVGDDDQSIFGFNGACANNFTSFGCFFPHPSKVCLRQNYRSTASIVEAAGHLIERNNASGRAPKRPFTSNAPGQKISPPMPAPPGKCFLCPPNAFVR